MASRQYIKKLKTDIERTIQGLRTKPREFILKIRKVIQNQMLYILLIIHWIKGKFI